jgi:hypothetical protein
MTHQAEPDRRRLRRHPRSLRTHQRERKPSARHRRRRWSPHPRPGPMDWSAPSRRRPRPRARVTARRSQRGRTRVGVLVHISHIRIFYASRVCPGIPCRPSTTTTRIADNTGCRTRSSVCGPCEARNLLRAVIKTFADALMPAEADALCHAEYGAVSEERVDHRNGYRPRGPGPSSWPSPSCGRTVTSRTGSSSARHGRPR